MTEYTLEMAGPVRTKGLWVERIVNGVSALLMVAWSVLWLPPLWRGVRTLTDIGQNGLAVKPSGHQLFELVFVAAHWGVRWLPGMLLLVGAMLATRAVARRQRA